MPTISWRGAIFDSLLAALCSNPGFAAEQEYPVAIFAVSQIVRDEIGAVQVFRKSLSEQQPARNIDTDTVIEHNRTVENRMNTYVDRHAVY